MKGFPRSLLAQMQCPYCGSALEVDVDFGAGEHLQDAVLRCECYEYPVVSGIAVLRQMSPVSSTANEAVAHLRRGDARAALEWLVTIGAAPGVPSVRDRAAARGKSLLSRLRRVAPPPAPSGRVDWLSTDGFVDALRSSRPGGYADYLFHRFANPSFLGALTPLTVFGASVGGAARGRMLELLGGIGHSSAVVAALYPDLEIVLTDYDFVNLYLARRFVAPHAVSVCVDAEIPLPFVSGSFDGVYCLDGLHYVRSKVALLREIDRLVSSDGVWLFAHMHNARATNVNPGTPLDPKAYSRRFDFGEQRLLAEAEVLRQFQENDALDLTSQADLDALDTSSALTLFGARSRRVWRKHEDLANRLRRSGDPLALNPLYRLEKTPAGAVASASWPSDFLRAECMVTPVLRDPVPIGPRVFEQLSRGGDEAASREVAELIRAFALVPLPSCYGRSSLTDLTETDRNVATNQ